MRRLKRKNIKRFKRFKHQALKPILTFVRACPEFNSGMTTTISVILNLIQNQLDPDFRQDDIFVSMMALSCCGDAVSGDSFFCLIFQIK